MSRAVPSAVGVALILLLTAGTAESAGPPAPSGAVVSMAQTTGTTTDTHPYSTPTASSDSGGAVQVVPGDGSAHARIVAGGWEIPDPTWTPGAVLSTDAATVCTPGYSKSVRNVPVSLKEQVYAEYGIAHHVPYQYEIDHDISLELGGSNDVSNLWPEPNDKARGNTKDELENRLHDLVCSNQMSLPDAQSAVKGDWTIAYRQYVGPLGEYRSNGLG